jgi:hypothetical protein|tara:strand:- start:794 stop:1321 length:528 start_codon:yes stop_codon:yes gene_type:complete
MTLNDALRIREITTPKEPACAPVPDLILEPLARATLREDVGTNGDLTTRTDISHDSTHTTRSKAREPGDVIAPDNLLMEIAGDAASILSGERVALNFAGRMFGISTPIAAFVAEKRGTEHPRDLHSQDHAGIAARGKTGCAAWRRFQLSGQPVRRHLDSGQPHRRGGHPPGAAIG